MDKDTIQKIRRFNRYYTVWLEVLDKGYLETGFTWPESRVLFELYFNPGINATELCAHLDMDKGYASRILVKLEKNGFLTRELIAGHKGMKRLCLTKAGREKASLIDRRGDTQISEKLKNLGPEACDRLCDAMALIEQILRNYDGSGGSSPQESGAMNQNQNSPEPEREK